MDNVESINLEVIHDGRIVCFIHRFGECKRYGNVTPSSFARLVRMQVKLIMKGQNDLQ